MSKKITVGPVGYMPHSAPSMGVELSPAGKALLYGNIVDEEEAMRDAARAMLTMANPTIFPGPQVLWDWREDVAAKSEAIMDLAAEIPNCRIIPMPDYRPKYPKIDAEAEINPNHPNLTILHNKIKGPGPDRAVVFQNHSLLPWLSVYANIEMAVKKVMPELDAQELRERVEKFVSMVNLEPAKDKLPGEISGGMKQRVGIARALSIQPDVLLMDEPFGALDSLTRANLQEHLMRIQQNVKNTVIIITHDIDEAVLLSDRVIMMTNGPEATIGEILEVNLERPRNRVELQHDEEYIRCREAILSFLYEKFAKEDE